MSAAAPSAALLTAPDAVAVVDGDGCPRVRVTGSLDAPAAASLQRVCDELFAGSPDRVELDLSGVTTVTADGVRGVTRCLVTGRRLSGGIGVLVASPAGRRALLESMAHV